MLADLYCKGILKYVKLGYIKGSVKVHLLWL